MNFGSLVAKPEMLFISRRAFLLIESCEVKKLDLYVDVKIRCRLAIK